MNNTAESVGTEELGRYEEFLNKLADKPQEELTEAQCCRAVMLFGNLFDKAVETLEKRRWFVPWKPASYRCRNCLLETHNREEAEQHSVGLCWHDS